MSDNLEAIKENMYNMLKYSKEEYDRYKKTDNVVWLQQAGEKLFCVMGCYIQYMHSMKVESFTELKSLIRERPLRRLLYNARDLHKFFYNQNDFMNAEDADELYLDTYNKVKSRIDRIDKYDVGIGV